MTSQPPYCVIGAGAAGLAAIKTLRDQGIDADCFEKSDRVGGHWHVDYDALHLITPKGSSCFDDYPMPVDYPLYPNRDQVREYIRNYAEHFHLYDHIQFNSTVEHIAPLGNKGDAGWEVTVNGQVRHYAGVVVANGHLWDPAFPPESGDFTGISLHSCQYQNTSQLQGRRVLVVGCGNSGCDLAADAAQHRFDTDVVMRRGQVFQPKALFGLPRAELPFINQLPPELQNSLTQILILASLGSWKNYPGMPEPETWDLEQQPPVVNNLLLYWIQHGRINVRPAIERIQGKTVTFTDGNQGEYDNILWATGFHATLPFIDGAQLEWRDGVPLRTAAMTLPTTLENLYFVGLAAPRGAQWPVYCQQTRLIARMMKLQTRGLKNLAALLASQQQPDARIDIVRRLWQQNYDETDKTLDLLEKVHVGAVQSIFTPSIS
ncbi:flavin-containing monooxygenase [Martelella alba]|uniref:Trimethylamine monooxygenase n=1 Tax=Martelella alba TaxID=2590451 RepID=A0ABY2SMJ7_9HYPH|nr:NAD(P)-binding domain-containing protein [Martelella alba]TKI06994.1 NAD(P)/FAD-dependent oxidoreductase [Martelella alba]